jgi:NADPH-dependent 2,4-dienoyl-CoA reductase/sulfur reductase-like enzyme
MRFVVIGGDAAGMSAASKAKRNDKAAEVVVLEKTQDVSYSACGMPYNLADPARNMDELIVRTADEFRANHGIDLRLGHTALRIDTADKVVHGTKGGQEPFEIHYDKLLIATGAGARNPDIPGISWREWSA